MSRKQHFINATLVLSDRVETETSLLVEDGIVRAIGPNGANGAEILDLAGKTLMPGMIDLHCDALEKEVEPRPNVFFPLDFAVAQADKRNAAAGITTGFHAVSFAHEELGVRSNEMAARMVSAVHEWSPHALVDNRVHCRYEITDETSLPTLTQLLSQGTAHLLSLMDHTPGQGQFKDTAAYRDYLTRTYRRTDQEVDALLRRKQEAAAGALERMETLAEQACLSGVSIASHDDDSAVRVETMRRIGAVISEFPIDIDTARVAREAGMRTVVRAPNVLRGTSQSRSMRAVDAIDADVVDCLCADYAPATLLSAVLRLPALCELDLPDAVRMVTLNPAEAAGLDDRGEIRVGKRADLIAVETPGGLPQVTGVWVKGVEICRNRYGLG